MNDDFGYREDREDAEQAIEAIRRAGRVDFALRIARNLQAAGAPRPLAIAFQETVTPMLPPESPPGAAQGAQP